MESNRGLYIFGNSQEVSYITRHLASLTFLTPLPRDQVFKTGSVFKVVVAPCDFTSSTNLKIVHRLFTRLAAPNICKAVYSTNPENPYFEQIMFTSAIGADYFAFGEEKDSHLKNFLKQSALSESNDTSLNKTFKELKKAANEANREKVTKIYHRLHQIQRDSSLSLRMKIIASKAMGKTGKISFFIKKMLEINPQDLWASAMLGKTYMQESQYKKAVEFLLSSTDLGGEFDPQREETDDLKLIKEKLRSLTPSAELLEFLQVRGVLSHREGRYDEAIYFFNIGLRMVGGHPVEEAKLLFHKGQALVKMNQPEKAAKVWEKSIELGGSRFNKAMKSLQQLQPILANLPPEAG